MQFNYALYFVEILLGTTHQILLIHVHCTVNYNINKPYNFRDLKKIVVHIIRNISAPKCGKLGLLPTDAPLKTGPELNYMHNDDPPKNKSIICNTHFCTNKCIVNYDTFTPSAEF